MFQDPTSVAEASAFLGTARSFVKLSESAQNGSVFKGPNGIRLKIRHVLPNSGSTGLRRHQVQLAQPAYSPDSVFLGDVQVNMTIVVPQAYVGAGYNVDESLLKIAAAIIGNSALHNKLLNGEN